MDVLPLQLVEIVLLCKQLKRCQGLLRCVCKTWRDLLVDQRQCALQWCFVSYETIEWSMQFDKIKRRVMKMDCLTSVAKWNSLALLRYLRQHHKPWNTFTLFYAVMQNNLAIVKWIYSCRPAFLTDVDTDDLLRYALNSKSLHMVQFVSTKSCATVRRHHIEACIQYGCIDILEWIWQPEYKDSYKLVRAAIIADELSVVKWLRKRGCPYRFDCVTYAIDRASMKVIIWIVTDGCPFDREDMIALAQARNRDDVVTFLST